MVATGVPARSVTTLTYTHHGERAVFHGIVDTTNLEIFRDFLSLLPTQGDVEVSIAGLELRMPEASTLLVDHLRALPPGSRLIWVGDPDV